MTDTNLIEIFCIFDDFCKYFTPELKKHTRKRSVIETVNDELKNVCKIEYARHRFFNNFATNLIAGLIAYNLLPKKPEMNIEIIDKSRIIA